MNLKCPNCDHEFALDNLIESQIIIKHKALIAKDIEDLKKRERDFEAKVQQARTKYKDELKEKTKQIEIEIKSKVDDDYKSKIDLYEQEIFNLKSVVKSAEKIEFKLRQENSTLLEQKEAIDLEVARRVAQELEKTRRQAVELNEQQHNVELLEKEQTISDLKALIDNLNRKARQASQQQQGEVGEIMIEDVLRQEFPEDEITPVPKGHTGADIIQCVIDNRGRRSGKLIIEIKRTKNWSNQWIDKIKNDQREEHADLAVIISEALPDMSKRKFANIDGIWVCDFAVFRELISTLRYQLIDIFRLSLTRKNENSKAAIVYDYISGTEFKQTVAAIMDSLKQAKENLEHEKTVMQKSWTRREKLMERISFSSIKISSDFEVLTGNIEEEIHDFDHDDVA